MTLRRAVAVDVLGDGSCLFHAIAHSLEPKLSGHALREIAATILEKYPEELLHGVSLSNWIKWDHSDPNAYSEKIRNNMWGGALEMTILASVLNVKMFVYLLEKDKVCSRVTDVFPDQDFVKKFRIPVEVRGKHICLLWVNKCHYMHLRLE
jgi:hypothetical protein